MKFPGLLRNRMEFSDGSSLTWADRETLRYEEGGYVALVWVDYLPGFFSRGRLIRVESLAAWVGAPRDSPTAITEGKRTEIIEKVRSYFPNRPVVVDT